MTTVIISARVGDNSYSMRCHEDHAYAVVKKIRIVGWRVYDEKTDTTTYYAPSKVGDITVKKESDNV